MGFKLIYGPANSGKTGYIHNEYKKEIIEQKRPILVLPDQADAFRSSKELSRELNSMIGGSILTFGNLFGEIVSMAQKKPEVINSVQRLVLLKKSVSEAGLDLLFASSKYSGFLEKVSRAINDLIACGLTSENLQAMIDSGKLGTSPILSEFNKIYAGYTKDLGQIRLVEYGQLGFMAVDKMDRMPPGRRLFVHKFEEFSRPEKEFIEQYARSNEVTVSYTYDESKLFSENDATLQWLISLAKGDVIVLRSQSANYSDPALFAVESGLFAKAGKDTVGVSSGIRLMKAAGIHNEIELAGSQIAKLIKGRGPEVYRPNEIAVIVRDRSYQPEILRIFKRYGLPVGIRAGFRMQETNFGRSFLALYRGVVNRQKKDLLEFLRSDFSHMSGEEFGRLEKAALSGLKDYKYLLGVLLGDEVLSTAIKTMRSTVCREKIEGLLQLSRGMLDGYLKRSGTVSLIDSDSRALDLNAYTAITEALESLEKVFESGSQTHDILTDKELINFISRLKVQMTEKPEEERIQVLSPQDSRGRRFKVVFILGLNEGSYPRRSGEDPFISNAARRSLRDLGYSDLQTYEFDPLSEMKLFYMMVTRARNLLYISYCFSDEKGSQRLQSNYLAVLLDLFSQDAKIKLDNSMVKKDLKDMIFSNIEDCPNLFEIKRTLAGSRKRAYEGLPQTLADELKRAAERAVRETGPNGLQLHGLADDHFGPGKIVGVTEIERYIKCRYKWFAQNALKIRPLFEQFSKANIGLIFHNIASEIYRSLDRDRIKDLSELPVDEMILKAEQLAAKELRAIDLPEMETILTKDLLLTLLKSAFTMDKERGGSYIPRYFEQPFGNDPEGFPALSFEEGGSFSFAGRIDRIDVCEDSKKAVIVDYKTGNIPTSFKPENYLQIVLYAMAAKRALEESDGVSTVAAAFQYPKQGKTKAVLLEQSGRLGFSEEKTKFEELMKVVLSSISEAVDSLNQGDISPNADDCKYCDLDQVCRRKAN